VSSTRVTESGVKHEGDRKESVKARWQALGQAKFFVCHPRTSEALIRGSRNIMLDTRVFARV